MRKPLQICFTFYLLATVCFLNGCQIFKHGTNRKLKPEMVFIKGGSYQMGDIYQNENPDATPVHTVTLSDFKIGKYEVTYRQYDAFAQKTGRELPHADSLGRGLRAVAYVSWEEARAFCAFFGWRLPTEEEWEYAARSGGKRQRFAGTNDIDSLEAYARTSENSSPNAFPVGTKRPNDAGLYDMSGNMVEWIGRYYQYYPKEGTQPTWSKMDPDGIRILRGGSYRLNKQISATYWRIGMLADSKENDVGFRCADPISQENSP
jgi:formylglycine-generating enzyme required for sulfatase activity